MLFCYRKNLSIYNFTGGDRINWSYGKAKENGVSFRVSKDTWRPEEFRRKDFATIAISRGSLQKCD